MYICCLSERGETMHPRLGNNLGLRRMDEITRVVQIYEYESNNESKRNTASIEVPSVFISM